jgi:hypothetical protein
VPNKETMTMTSIPKTTKDRKQLDDTAALQGWADKINMDLAHTVAGIIKTGDDLCAAKRALKHGKWERLFDKHSLERPVPLSIGTAQRFMKISQHPVLSNTAHGPLLPGSWRTLYELSRVPTRVLRKALTDGRISPDMERRSAEALRGTDKDDHHQVKPKHRLRVQAPASEILMQLTTFLRDLVHQLSPSDLAVVLTGFECMIAEIRQEQADGPSLHLGDEGASR